MYATNRPLEGEGAYRIDKRLLASLSLLVFKRGWVGSATLQEGGKGRLFSLPFLCSEQPVGVGKDPEGDPLLTFLVRVL